MFALISLLLIHYAPRLCLAANELGYYDYVPQTQQSYGYDYPRPSKPFGLSANKLGYYDHVPQSQQSYRYDYPRPKKPFGSSDISISRSLEYKSYSYSTSPVAAPAFQSSAVSTSPVAAAAFQSSAGSTSPVAAAAFQSSAGDLESAFGQRISEKMCRQLYFPVIPPGFKAVFGGRKSEPNEFLFMAAIGWNVSGGGYDYRCGGSLISDKFVLTAGHCRSLRGNRPDVVRLGGGSLDSTDPAQQPIAVTDLYVHPQYMRRQIYNDIALLKIKSFSVYYPACLWPSNTINYRTATVIGYGRTENDPIGSNDLITADLNLISNEVCSPYYPPGFRYRDGLISSQLCAGDFNRAKDTCPGDSGGPILVKRQIQGTAVPYILGITSFGAECGQGVPAIYTRVSSYIDWIESYLMQGNNN